MKPTPMTSADTDGTDESAITRCPACGTLFRVFATQLTISKGWARCGQCHEVFNAEHNLVDEVATSGEALAEDAVRSVTTGPAPSEAGMGSTDAEHKTPPEEHAKFPSSASGISVADRSGLLEPDYAYEIEEVTRERDVGQSNGNLDPEIVVEPVGLQQPPIAGVLTTAPPQRADIPPSFMSPTQSASRHSWAAWFAVMGFVLALTIQALWVWRSEVASQWPKASPWISQVCNALGCSVDAPRRLAALQLDNVSVSAVDGGAVYLLRMLIKSRTDQAIAPPSVELSLQASDESLITRRVFTAQDLGLPPLVLPPNSEHTVSMVIAIDNLPGRAVPKVASYTALAFYP